MSYKDSELSYINNRIANPDIYLECNKCGYRWLKKRKITFDSLEQFEDYTGHDHCPMCGSSEVYEVI